MYYIMQGLGDQRMHCHIVAGQPGMLAAKSIPATIIFTTFFFFFFDIQAITYYPKENVSFMMASKIAISASDDYKYHH